MSCKNNTIYLQVIYIFGELTTKEKTKIHGASLRYRTANQPSMFQVTLVVIIIIEPYIDELQRNYTRGFKNNHRSVSPDGSTAAPQEKRGGVMDSAQ